MNMNFDEIVFNFYKKFLEISTIVGFMAGKIKPYDQEVIKNLGNYYYGDVPLNIRLLLPTELCDGFCYDCATLIANGMPEDVDYNLLYGPCKSIELNPNNHCTEPYDAEHCVLEIIDENGKKWIYDTSLGLVFKEHYYKFIHGFKPTRKRTKEEIIDFNSAQITEKITSAAIILLLPLEPIIKHYEGLYKRELSNAVRDWITDLITLYPEVKERIKESCPSYLEYLDECDSLC